MDLEPCWIKPEAWIDLQAEDWREGCQREEEDEDELILQLCGENEDRAGTETGISAVVVAVVVVDDDDVAARQRTLLGTHSDMVE